MKTIKTIDFTNKQFFVMDHGMTYTHTANALNYFPYFDNTDTLATPRREQKNSLASAAVKVREVLYHWCSLLEMQKPQAMVNLYHERSVLLATLVDEPLITPTQKLAYFEALTARDGIHAVISQQHVRMLGDGAAVISGLYSFHFCENGIAMQIPARFSMVFEKRASCWMIVEHHSSRLPA